MSTAFKHILPRNVLFSIYNTLALPHFQYRILAWGNTHASYLNKLLIVITNSSFREHTAPLFKQFKTLDIFKLYKYHLGVLMFKFESNLLPGNIRLLFSQNMDIHSHNTGSGTKIHIGKARTTSQYLYLELCT